MTLNWPPSLPLSAIDTVVFGAIADHSGHITLAYDIINLEVRA